MSKDGRVPSETVEAPSETVEAPSDWSNGDGSKSEVESPSQDEGRPEGLKIGCDVSGENVTRGLTTASGEVVVGGGCTGE